MKKTAEIVRHSGCYSCANPSARVAGNVHFGSRIVLFLALGCIFFLLFPFIPRFYDYYYQKKEPFFSSPVMPKSNIIFVRTDRYGKGYFGASRNGGRTHQGLDLVSPVGGPVSASKSGRVIVSGEDSGYGMYIELRHPDGHRTRYAHLSELRAREGDWVFQHQPMGKSGKSGNAANPLILAHLHFEIRTGERAINPLSPRLIDPSITIQ